jgi:hypothetical protein
MSDDGRIGPLEINADERVMRRDWRMEHVGRWTMLLLLVLAAAGVFSHGPAASATVEDRGMRLQYERIARHHAPTRLDLELPATAARDTLRVWLSREYRDGVEVQDIIPQPDRTLVHADRVVYEFSTIPSDQPVRLAFLVEPDDEWKRQGAFGVDGVGTVRFTQLVLP